MKPANKLPFYIVKQSSLASGKLCFIQLKESSLASFIHRWFQPRFIEKIYTDLFFRWGDNSQQQPHERRRSYEWRSPLNHKKMIKTTTKSQERALQKTPLGGHWKITTILIISTLLYTTLVLIRKLIDRQNFPSFTKKHKTIITI